MTLDAARLTADLIRCASVTPADDGALDVLERVLSQAGFSCTRVDRGGICNLFARWGDKGHARSFGFNGHTDVVPVGDAAAWTVAPFGAEEKDGFLYGRGATDMKSGVAAFVAAAVDLVTTTPPEGAVIVTITGDEEGDALDGTKALLDYMAASGERMSVCLVGEPTCPDRMGEMIKIGRRGSMTAWFTVTGVQGHSAYPHRAKNPLPAMARLMDRLASHGLDQGTDHFDPSTLAVVTIDTGNTATNVIPAQCRGAVNIRFNDLHSGASLTGWMQGEADRVAEEFGVAVEMKVKISGESFLTPPGELSDLVAAAVEAETGVTPVLSTSGGTSDARFVKDHCPVVEFGLVGRTMHQVDERVEIAQIHQLKAIYGRILRDFFA
ncbi:succinyl-diaminopimelate desuccinylase [Ruegeria pomeroyi]|jgi:succinyl-diaminopimelate desuccinylase|uniref:Succinyl-diaminopimelate desuccinylase n=2 Tax=Ruegeria pomeroyi TaxID=89184 RepID=DAPE_RUEPO|nr:succinyl-diaminopimelate desuccinylase [Ruegeria pomeroyi]Q5LN80.1 RecName: Full=Succinyl-diaminopimelate desuccinylase; Short=SDAP desuccinylase; AltName: Full=N-succinyl-LL-2,6-diaminoheptanedioate amidohydrolase [Ruegeria pomeroyi DSS-3]HCE72884.1 succinyl-diaminopimelate desuccinylase [Ruegeria sp.]AAV96559.1 succinyl-diaminopimelate desuccinylase [Ruegeria pomeroyi DSS-3]NVK96151.1 succinyl-diaminopimelate desuccinylase [Ruegeria pomeroyi]NVL01021.1 succinyl-diaminopimelate desuccinyla